MDKRPRGQFDEFDEIDKSSAHFMFFLTAGVLLVVVCLVAGEVYYVHGFSSEAYKDGEYLGYSSHNESMYNKSSEYVRSHTDALYNIRGNRDIYFGAYGYVSGYRKLSDEMEVSEMCELMEIGQSKSR